MDNETVIDEARLRRFARLAAPLLRGHVAQGPGPHAARNRPGPGLEFLDLRNYAPGDDIRHIDWHQSSRRQQPMIRRYRDESAADWFLCLDGSASMISGDGKWTLAAHLTAALAYSLLHAGHRVALIIFANQIAGFCRLGRGAHQLAKLIKLMRAHDPEKFGGTDAMNGSNLGLCQDALSPMANAFIVSDFLTPDAMEKDLKALRARASSLSAIQVFAADEAAVPGRGLATLYDMETGKARRVDLSSQSRAQASATLQRHRKKLQHICRSLAVRWTNCTAGQDWERILLDHLHTAR